MRSTNDHSSPHRPTLSHRLIGSGETLIGIVEWFRPGQRERVEEVLADLRELDLTELRTGISWADYHSPGGPEWYSWLIPHLARHVSVLPCLVHASSTLGVAARSALPETAGSTYPAFVEDIIRRFGSHFDCVELGGEPAQAGQSDWAGNPDWRAFAGMIREAAWLARKSGKRTVLGGVNSQDARGLGPLFRHGAMDQIDVVGIHGFPGVWESNWQGWLRSIERIQGILDEYDSPVRIWITETGFPTSNHNLFRQVKAFLAAIESPAERVYWSTARDIDRIAPFDNGTCIDERELHFGLKTASGGHKLLSRMWADHGIEGLYRLQRSARRLPQPSARRYTLITGGAGFIGSNLADRLMGQGRHVMVLDSLARPGVERNLEWLQDRHGDRLITEIADIRNAAAVRRAVQKAEQVFDFSAQVAVTTSLIDPIEDFEINAHGTVGLLEAIRATGRTIPLVFTSTNKVYGSLQDVRLRCCGDRYEPVSRCLRMQGIDEQRPLDFHSPYGCSKGSADQYVLDYARTLGLAAVVFRMSCIYGPRQFGTEDQGWVAHFLIQAMQGLPITLYGDGRQVRDILFVEDLLDAFELAQANIGRFSGQAFNIGGGPPRTISLLELLHVLEELTGDEPVIRHESWRPADQKYYVSNTQKFQRATGWGPKVSVREGVTRLYEWLCAFRAPAAASKAPTPAATASSATAAEECVGK